jgi:uncharacterized protein YggE
MLMISKVGCLGVAIALALAPSAWAADDSKTPRIVIVGSGRAMTPPDLAELGFTIRGEGPKPDSATLDLVNKRTAIESSLTGITATSLQVTTGEMHIREVRSNACTGDNDDGGHPHLSVGDCAVQGYVAELEMTVRLSPPSQAGTAAGLIARQGGAGVHASSFSLRDPRDAQSRATAAALQDARMRAQAIAAGTGVKLGAIISVQDEQAATAIEDIVVTGASAVKMQAARAPIQVDLRPEPISTEVRLVVTYGIGP